MTTMDVVFIHGLNGDLLKTWTDDEDCFWPDWLLEDFPEANIWAIGYDASPTKWKKETLSFFKRSQSISEHLRTEGIGSRPVSFICHSLGGLIVKQILRSSIIDAHLGQCQIYDNTRGVVFLATPHRGSALANLFSKVHLLRTTKLVEYLKCNEDSIEDLYYFYRKSLIPTLSFHETERTPLFKALAFCQNIPLTNELLCPIVVPEKSADCGIGGEPSPIEKNHYDICKFNNKDNSHYKMLLNFLRDNICKEDLLSVRDIPENISGVSKIDTIRIEMSSSIANGDWEKTKQLIHECEEILDNNMQLPNRAETYLFLADSEKSRVDESSRIDSEEKDYSIVNNLINKAKRANE
ncbi:esterase/lipase family protein [Planctomycetota bacterium]